MPTSYAAPASSRAVPAAGIGRLAGKVTARRRRAARTQIGRIIHMLGQMLAAFPASTWLVLDISLIVAGLYAGYERFPPADLLPTPHVALWQAACVFALTATVATLIFGLYERETLLSRSRICIRMMLTAITVTVLAYAIIHIAMYSTISRRLTTLAMSGYLVGGALLRLFAWWAIRRVSRGLLVVGSPNLLDSFEREQVCGGLPEFKLIGYASTREITQERPVDKRYLGSIRDEMAQLHDRGVTDIVVGAECARDPNVMDWIVPSLQAGCRVTDEATFYEKATGQILVDELTPAWFLIADLRVHCERQATMKRVLDLTTASLGLCLTAPLWPLIALAIKLCDGGPVFYSQDRVGQHGTTFKLYKFRTMRTDAENGKSVWASRNDPRVTLVGRLLRKTRLDELPQLYNVLIGQMSVIGPRPERPDIVAELCDKIPYYAERHLVKPGVTGWAQISFRYGSSIEDAKRKLHYDLYYLKHMSLDLDTIILFRTVGTVLRGAC